MEGWLHRTVNALHVTDYTLGFRFRKRERARGWRGEVGTKGEKESIPSRLRAEPDTRLNPTALRS